MEQGMSQAEAIDTVCNDADKTLLRRVPTEDDKLIDFTTTEITECGTGKDTESTEDLTEEKNLSIDSIEGRVQAYQDEIKTISDMTKDGVEDDLISVVAEMYEDGKTSLDHRDEKVVLSWIKKNSKLSAEEFFKKLVDQMNDLINRLQSSKTEALDEGHYGKGEIHDGDISSKISFVEAISRRFHNMGFDESTHGLKPGTPDQSWNPYKENSVVMFGPSVEFFKPITDYIASEVTNKGSAWYNRESQVVEVTDSAIKTVGGDNYIFVSTFSPEKLTKLLNINPAWAEHFEGAEVLDATAEGAPKYAAGYRSYMFGPSSAYFYRLVRWFDGYIEAHPEADARMLRLPYSEIKNGKQAYALCIYVAPEDFDPPKRGTGAELKRTRAANDKPAA